MEWKKALAPAHLKAGPLSLLIVLVFVLLSIPPASKPFHLDSMDFEAAATQTAATGIPVYYRGEENPRHLGTYHPPLYIYVLAAWIRLFGSGEAQVRMFGMLCALIQGLVVLEILRTLFGSVRTARYQPWFWLIFLLNPYTVQTAGIADIDTTIYGPLLCLVLLITLRFSWRGGEWRAEPVRNLDYVLLALSITLCLWAKLTTILLVPPFLFLLLFKKLGVSRAALAFLAASVAGAAGFLLTYWIYGKITGVDINYTFAFTWMSFVERGSSGTPGILARLMDYKNNFLGMVPLMVAWTGMLPWIAGPMAVILAWRRGWLAKDTRAMHYSVLMALALVTTGYYCAKTVTFGGAPYKYTFVYWGLILTAPVVLVLGGLANPVEWQQPKRASFVAAAAFVLLYGLGFVIASRVLHDTLIYNGLSRRYAWVLLPPAFTFFLGGLARWRTVRALLLASLVFYCGVQTGVALYQSHTDYATTYDYGQAGFLDTVAFIRANTGPDDLIASMKDIGYRAQRRYFENYAVVYGDVPSTQRLMEQLASGKIKLAVFTEGRGQDQLLVNHTLSAWISANCTLLRSYGNYRIYQYSGPHSGAASQ